jgi:glycosyltransferase involved in cell wall biosynthesis
MNTLRDTITVLTWDPVCRRSVSLARQLGRPLHTVHYLWYRRPWIAPIKYVAQTIKTFFVLRRERPEVVLISNPPPFSVLAVYAYCRLFGGRYVMDSHTGVFFEAKWRWLGFLNRFLSRRALFTIVTNDHLKSLVESWGAAAFVLEDALPDLAATGGSAQVDRSKFNVAAIFSFYEDEPIEEMLAVSDLPPDVHVYVTGDHSRVPGRITGGISDQVTLTGFLRDEDYAALLHQCDAVVVLCTRPHTMLCGAYEAATAGKPLATSDWPEMRAYFRRGTVFVDNSTASIEHAIRTLQQNREEFTREMRTLRGELQTAWDTKFLECVARMTGGGATTRRRVVSSTRANEHPYVTAKP